MGMGEINADTIGHDKLGILGTNQLFLSKKPPVGTAVRPNVTSQIITFVQCSGFQTNLIALS